ncbi:Reverse transcriptase, RNA-dependent DNA polymerase [Metarhizium album ARSEF 1941]|uniref:Reverse transcriptase, RNA-dependent DNA polymerase n=1 Tax=Metarhizium album (strain ARSEF 1941) TaxID=1081103 RepID=A0A0B2WU09_METAS|nr:Reverse transcriptase, RNA-dependent DNA polymerase [Metarhizium album ARSEF 1941]KHN96405.1 Reverse transcriptase, RNA-dependent DNA polymerase [Metarhizium album ARSEF 1941]
MGSLLPARAPRRESSAKQLEYCSTAGSDGDVEDNCDENGRQTKHRQHSTCRQVYGILDECSGDDLVYLGKDDSGGLGGIVGAWLFSEKTEAYIQQHKGFTDGTNKVWKLNKALYSLRQSLRIWHETLTKFLLRLGFKQSTQDASEFLRNSIILAVHVDDLVTAEEFSEGLVRDPW